MIKSLCQHVKCAIRINGTHTEWFRVNSGLNQGCVLSPQLFNMFANDLVHAINELNCGLSYSDADHVSILIYADDIVLLSDDELKMQTMLDCLNKWCRTWGLIINFDKSKTVHFKAVSSARTKFNFVCGISSLELVDQYKYLGIVFTEHLDLMQMSKIVAQSASRALGLLILKSEALGGMTYECFTKCNDAPVQSIVDYSAAVWGTKSVSPISAVQNRACRFFRGLGRYSPNAAVNDDMGWPAPEQRQWMCITRKWCRLVNLDESIITKKVFQAHLDRCNPRYKTWCHRVKCFTIN